MQMRGKRNMQNSLTMSNNVKISCPASSDTSNSMKSRKNPNRRNYPKLCRKLIDYTDLLIKKNLKSLKKITYLRKLKAKSIESAR